MGGQCPLRPSTVSTIPPHRDSKKLITYNAVIRKRVILRLLSTFSFAIVSLTTDYSLLLDLHMQIITIIVGIYVHCLTGTMDKTLLILLPRQKRLKYTILHIMTRNSGVTFGQFLGTSTHACARWQDHNCEAPYCVFL